MRMTPRELFKIRQKAGLTQADFARALGYKGPANTLALQVWRFESGYRLIPPHIAHLAYMLGEHGVPPALKASPSRRKPP